MKTSLAVIASVLSILPLAASLAPLIPASTTATKAYIANAAAITSLPSSGTLYDRKLAIQARDNAPWGYIRGNSGMLNFESSNNVVPTRTNRPLTQRRHLASLLSCETGNTFTLETYTSSGRRDHFVKCCSGKICYNAVQLCFQFWGQQSDETDTASACSRLGFTSCMYWYDTIKSCPPVSRA
jgi:hypothetical protein